MTLDKILLNADEVLDLIKAGNIAYRDKVQCLKLLDVLNKEGLLNHHPASIYNPCTEQLELTTNHDNCKLCEIEKLLKEEI